LYIEKLRSKGQSEGGGMRPKVRLRQRVPSRDHKPSADTGRGC
jgi:hypothetical protein